MEMGFVDSVACFFLRLCIALLVVGSSSGALRGAEPATPAPTGAGSIGIDPATLEKWSEKFLGWGYHPDHVIPAKPEIEGFAAVHSTDVPTVFQIPGDRRWYMTFIGFDGKGYQSFLASSDDLVRWKQMGLAMGYGPEGEFDHGGVVLGAFLLESYAIDAPRTLKKHAGKYWSLYGAYPRQGGYELRPGYEGVASSEDGKKWTREQKEPILSVHQPDRGEWEKDCIYQPWLVEHEGRYWNFYNAANGGTEQMGLAMSTDLLHWARFAGNPVLRNRPGGYDEGFCSDGKVFHDGDHWTMLYFGVGRGGAHIMAAFSRDLIHWAARPEPLYKAGGHPGGLDRTYAHKISLVWDPPRKTWYMFYNAVGDRGRGIGLITSRPLTVENAQKEPGTFSVILKESGARKIQVIKEVRAVTGLGLKDAKDLVEGAPRPVKEGVSREEALKIKKQLEDAGATVELTLTPVSGTT